MTKPEFHLHEDDWGMVSLEPEENRFERAKVMGQARAFGEAHRADSGAGWTDIMVVPAAPVNIAARAITLAALRDALGPGCAVYDRVTSGYSSHSEDVEAGYAIRCSDHARWNVIYGVARDGVISQLHVTHCTEAMAAILHRLGTVHRLILCDLWRDQVVELGHRPAIDRYLAEDAEDDDEEAAGEP